MDEIETGPERWAARPFLLAGLGLATGVAAQLILGEKPGYYTAWSALQIALLIGVTLGAAMIGFTIERRRWLASLGFALVVGVAAGLISWWNGAPGGWGGSEGWRTMSLLLAVAIAAPLFQAARDEGRLRTPYAAVHDYAWTNVVLWFACWLFVLIVWIMAWLLASLFQLIKIELLRELLDKNWFVRALIGLAFGSALGILREHDAVVRLLQRVVATVLSVLAPVLAVGLGLFLLALPFTGVQALWDATQATTPLLLSCATGALILANAVLGNHVEEERRNPVLRYGAMVLGGVLLPLAILAAVATGLRVGQYGYTPERLWAVVFVGIALLYGTAYLGSLLIGRLGWARWVRPANLGLAFVICGLGLLLATPLISFNAISTRDQVARLESGRIRPDKFDWFALTRDFGKPGLDAWERLKRSTNPAIRAKAIEHAKDLEDLNTNLVTTEPVFTGSYKVPPAGKTLPEALRKAIGEEHACDGDKLCRVYLHDAKTATVIADGCAELPLEKRTDPKNRCDLNLRTYLMTAQGWKDLDDFSQPVDPEAKPLPQHLPEAEERSLLEREDRAISGNDVTVRKVEMRQVFIGDKPQGRPFK